MSKLYILMGVSGVGKTTLGIMLSKELSVPFYDADDFHSTANREKMENGTPLNDEDREGWLKEISKHIPDWISSGGGVLACSALKEKYRRQLSNSNSAHIEWIFLYEDFNVIAERIRKRKLHFFDPNLLKSQFDTLESPDYGIHIKVENSPEESLKEIVRKLNRSEIGIIGLGVMGQSLALNMARNNFSVSVYNRQEGELKNNIAQNFANRHSDTYNFNAFDDLERFVSSLKSPRKILLMIKAGDPIDEIVEILLPLLQKGDIIMDGGNSNYKDTDRRSERLDNLGLHFMGIGISGGEEGALNGPSIMPGGSKTAHNMVKDILNKIAARDKFNEPCSTYIGPGSSGHFVKMVHNGIEYGEMQLIAEFYFFMRYFQERSPEEISKTFSEWNIKERSFLLQITVDILRKKEDGDYLLDKVLDVAGQKGTGGWSTNAALELGVALDTITASVFARNISAFKFQKAKVKELYSKNNATNSDISNEDLYLAFKSASIINHSIGFEMMRISSIEYAWDLDLSEIARIWTNGCIIRSDFMESLAEVYNSGDDQHLLLYPEIAEELNSRESFINVISSILSMGCPMQVSSSALNYLLSFT
ncbi:MAG TPA: NADP-dependent phosphogluconate dehydrogenase, partial [Christiangramia sp.]|nr:NADP-dependent phosphogluconate dehydrogenase [Christiangramia sp.]